MCLVGLLPPGLVVAPVAEHTGEDVLKVCPQAAAEVRNASPLLEWASPEGLACLPGLQGSSCVYVAARHCAISETLFRVLILVPVLMGASALRWVSWITFWPVLL